MAVTIAKPVTSISEVPAVKAALSAVQPLQKAHDALLDQERRLQHTIAQPDADVVERLYAQRNLASVQLQRLEAEAALEEARRTEQAARDYARDSVQQSSDAELRAAIKELRAALLVARAANHKVQTIQHRAHTLTCRPFDPLGIASLNGLIESWLSGTAAAGYGE